MARRIQRPAKQPGERYSSIAFVFRRPNRIRCDGRAGHLYELRRRRELGPTYNAASTPADEFSSVVCQRLPARGDRERDLHADPGCMAKPRSWMGQLRYRYRRRQFGWGGHPLRGDIGRRCLDLRFEHAVSHLDIHEGRSSHIYSSARAMLFNAGSKSHTWSENGPQSCPGVGHAETSTSRRRGTLAYSRPCRSAGNSGDEFSGMAKKRLFDA